MAWSLGGVTIHVYSDVPVDESLYAMQNVLDATTDTITWYGARSERRTIQFWLLPETSGSGARVTLSTARATNADVALVSYMGSEGNWRILSFKSEEVMDISRVSPVWNCSCDLIKST